MFITQLQIVPSDNVISYVVEYFRQNNANETSLMEQRIYFRRSKFSRVRTRSCRFIDQADTIVRVS